MKILVKIGSALISQNNQINYEFLKRKVDEISELQKKGHQVVIVTSGAVAAGMEIKGIKSRPKDILSLQLLSGMGQVALIKYYKEFFRDNGIFVAQVLVTHHNFDKESEVKTLMSVLHAYLNESIIPIINENDIIDKTELASTPVFSDNDLLSAIIAKNLNVDLTIILTDVDGLFEKNPKIDPNARFFDTISKITDETFSMANQGKSDLGLGGMISKVEAAKIITKNGKPVIVANGNYNVIDILEKRVRHTYFEALKEEL